MSRIMMLVSAEGVMLAETRVDSEGPEADAIHEAQLREEALLSGFSETEVRSAHLTRAGEPPFQP
ncbi:MAG: hypothetical protein ACYDD1_18125 [Caulobacteraceae bacterium]